MQVHRLSPVATVDMFGYEGDSWTDMHVGEFDARQCPGTEAQAALAAVQWVSGQQNKAEDHFEKAVALDARWSSMAYIRQQTRWPPALYEAMEKFLAIASPA